MEAKRRWAVLILASSWAVTALAQELEPRAYWVGPVGINSAIVGYSYSTGDNVTDPTLPLSNVRSTYQSLMAGYYRIFGFFGRSANFTVSGPYLTGESKGELDGMPIDRQLSGLADPSFRVSVNLKGGPTMGATEFQEFRRNPKTLVGVSVRVQPPLGQYDPNRLINPGTNRWAVKPQLGVVVPARPRWLLELYAGGWFFSDNKDFVGSTRHQAPLGTGEFYLIRRFRPGFWASLDTTFFYGGRISTDGGAQTDLQQNTRIGGTIVIPVQGSHVLKISYSTGLSVRSGGDYEAIAVGYQYIWRSKTK